MAKKKKSTRKKATKKKATKKKATRKKATKKRGAKKKTKKKVKKKTTKKKATKKKATKKKTKKKTTKKKATKKKPAKKKTTKKKATKKKATKKKATKKAATKKTTAKRATTATVNLRTYEPQVTEGGKVPGFSLPATSETTVTLSELTGKKVVLFFYPKDSTPGCTIEGKDFTRLQSDFSGQNTEVFGISRDSMKSHENFKSKQSYTIELISDAEEELCKIFGVIKIKNMYGKKVRGIERSTFLVSEDGILLKEWRKVQVPNHAQEVLDFVRGLSATSATVSQTETTSDEATTHE